MTSQTSQLSIRGYRTAFLSVVGLLAAVAGFTLYNQVRTAARVESLVTQALARDALMGKIRVAALGLESAVDDHIQSASDSEREAADDRMAKTLDDISLASQEYTRDLPPGERDIWTQFNDTSQSLAAQVRKAVTYSNRKEAERAKRHLVEKIRPVTAHLDHLADRLSRKNADETTELLGHLEALRLRTAALGAGVVGVAVILALLVSLRVVTLLRRQEATIQSQLGELDRRNKELDSFASRVAHDLVAPLSPLKGYLTLIRRSGHVKETSTQEMLALAETSAGRMAEMIEALLRFCRAGNPSPGAQGELDTAVTTLLLEVSQSAAAQGVALERQMEAGVRVPCPVQLLQSIAQNVLSNAVKYSAGRLEARVVVRVFKERGQGVLEVTDNGVGMSEMTRASLFQPFFRAPEARGLPGHGLGLATMKRLVEAHDGTVTVHSELGVGTQVTVRLPLLSGGPNEGAPRLSLSLPAGGEPVSLPTKKVDER